MDNVCAWCRERATLKCANCEEVFYCSKEHQKVHWKEHRTKCKVYQEVEDAEHGRYLVSSKFLPAGSLVLKETPFVIGPQATSPLICLGCHILITGNNFYRCSLCSWPMCSKACSNGIRHADECQILKRDAKKAGVPYKQGETPRYDLILIIRCLLLCRLDPSAWEKLMSLQSHAQERKKDGEPHHVAAIRFIAEVFKMDFDTDTLHHIRGAIITNGVNTKNASGMTLRGLYSNISLLNHSCHPNVTLRSSKDHTVYVRTTVDVNKDRPLVFSYVSVETPIWRRYEDLRNIYYFTCKCERCSDGTELGTYFSSPRCPLCSNYFKKDDTANDWKCVFCQNTKKHRDVVRESNELAEWIRNKKLSMKHLNLFIKRVGDKVHKDHFLYLEGLKKSLHFLKDSSARVAMETRSEIWSDLIRIHDLIEPGLTRRKGVSLTELAASKLESIKIEKSKSTFCREALLTRCHSTLQLITDSLFILSLEPPNSTEDQWVVMAKNKNVQLRKIIEELT